MSLKSPALFLLNDYARLHVGHSEKASMSKMSQKYSEFAFSNVWLKNIKLWYQTERLQFDHIWIF